MKTKIFVVLLWAMAMVSCYENNTTGADHPIADIAIEAFEKEYTLISYAQQKLELTAKITSGYAANDLTTNWYLINLDAEDNLKEGETLERKQIGTGNQLSYEVNLAPGHYMVVCEVMANNGYATTQSTLLNVESDFSSGFYLLKETADGNTDVDLFKPLTGNMLIDILAKTQGKPMQGKPRTLSVAFNHFYVDSETNLPTDDNMVSVTTQNGNFAAYRTADFVSVFNKSNFFFGPPSETLDIYRLISAGAYMQYLVTNEGLYGQYNAIVMAYNPGTGQYGLPQGNGGSQFICDNGHGSQTLFWEAQTQSIAVFDINGQFFYIEDAETPTEHLTGRECVYCGYNVSSETSQFLLKNTATGAYELYLINTDLKVEKRVLPASSCLVDAESYSTCGNSGAFIYAIKQGKPFAYSMVDGTETPLNLQGLPAGENLSYISNQYYSDKFDYLVVGSQTGNTYKLYFYKLLGGKPDGKYVMSTQGTGKFKSMKYMEAGVNLNKITSIPPFMD